MQPPSLLHPPVSKPSALQGIEARLQAFDAIGLDELDAVRLLNRTDTKFMLHADGFGEILDEIARDYYILEIDGRRVFNYHTQYFDTEDFALYKLHHNGRPNRLKIRFRKYLDSGQCFFEVKYKVKGARTDKHRIEVADLAVKLGQSEAALIRHDAVRADQLQMAMVIRFSRVTLASRQFSERLTLDFGLSFDNQRQAVAFPALVVAEIKAEKSARDSPIVRSFRRRHVDRTSFSKYSTSVAMLEAVKANAFKPHLIRLKRILEHGTHRL